MRPHTLAEAVTHGRGTERPFLCPVHEDSRPSAYVNVVKKKWYCFTCGARGKLTGAALLMEPNYYVMAKELEKSVFERSYSPSWLNQYDSGPVHPYWVERVGTDAARHFRLGFDREDDAVTYPFWGSQGHLRGVVRRKLGDHDGPKYRYPRGVDAGSNLGNYQPGGRKAVVLVEGFLDAVALWNIGIDAWCIYGARLGKRQIELIDQADPLYVFTAFDNDDAGYKAWRETERAFPHRAVVRLSWPKGWGKDIDEIGEERRRFVCRDLLTRSLSCVECVSCRSSAPSTPTNGRLSSTATSRTVRLRRKPSAA